MWNLLYINKLEFFLKSYSAEKKKVWFSFQSKQGLQKAITGICSDYADSGGVSHRICERKMGKANWERLLRTPVFFVRLPGHVPAAVQPLLESRCGMKWLLLCYLLSVQLLENRLLISVHAEMESILSLKDFFRSWTVIRINNNMLYILKVITFACWFSWLPWHLNPAWYGSSISKEISSLFISRVWSLWSVRSCLFQLDSASHLTWQLLREMLPSSL